MLVMWSSMTSWHLRSVDLLQGPVVLQIMAALIILESAVKPAYLKTSWRLWAFPAPNPALAGMPLHLCLSHYTHRIHQLHLSLTCALCLRPNHAKATLTEQAVADEGQATAMEHCRLCW